MSKQSDSIFDICDALELLVNDETVSSEQIGDFVLLHSDTLIHALTYHASDLADH